MPQNREYPAKTRSVAVGMSFPSRTKSAAVNEVVKGGPSSRGAHSDGKKPAKGVLTKGGGHG